MNGQPLLSVADVEVRHGAIPAVRGASLHVDEGEIVAVVGPNGAGKTTLLRSIIGLDRAARGSVSMDGRDITRLATEARVALGLSLVPQGRRIFTESSVEMNLWAGAFTRSDKDGVVEDIEHFLELFPVLRTRRQVPAGMLSGGEQQMLALARALMSHPRVLLLDEPSMGLAPIAVGQTFKALRELSEQGVTMLLVEQNVSRAIEIADRVYVLVTGELRQDVPAAEVDLDELAATFLGISSHAPAPVHERAP